MMRRCPQCGSAGEDTYGFCIKCGYEFPKVPENENTCPLCGFENPDEADFCVKCGSPLLFKNGLENDNTVIRPIVVNKQMASQNSSPEAGKTSRFVIYLGYLFSILGSILGLIVAIYLITRKDPNAKKHGYVQIAIILFYLIVLAILFKMGMIPPELINEYKQLLAGNFTVFNG